MSRLTLILACSIGAGCSTGGWRAQKINGNSPSAFETSVVSLQEQLPLRRRAEFETALAVIWMRSATLDAGDANSDGRVDMQELRALEAVADDVLTDIRRGVFAGSVPERGGAAANYLRQLDGQRYEDVIGLATITSGTVFAAAARTARDQTRCRNVKRDWRSEPTSFMAKFCARH
jgi:hypothetical protein